MTLVNPVRRFLSSLPSRLPNVDLFLSSSLTAVAVAVNEEIVGLAGFAILLPAMEISAGNAFAAYNGDISTVDAAEMASPVTTRF